MKLKTLKDLEWRDDYGEGFELTEEAKNEALKDGTYPTTGITELKEEAINWIKSMNSEIKNIERIPEAYHKWKEDGSPYIQNQEIIRWIKMFFDITEEDLK